MSNNEPNSGRNYGDFHPNDPGNANTGGARSADVHRISALNLLVPTFDTGMDRPKFDWKHIMMVC